MKSDKTHIMTDPNSATLQALLQYALPLGSTLLAGSPDMTIQWAVTIRAQPPAFPDIVGGELALVSMDIVRGYDSRITLAEVVANLADAGVSAVAVRDSVSQTAIASALERGIGLLSMPAETNLTVIERAVNKLILNQSAQLTQRALDIQRQLISLSAENRDLSSLLQIIARATAKPVVIHDDAGVMMAQMYPNVTRRSGGAGLLQSLPYNEFQRWLEAQAPQTPGIIAHSPIGHTIVIKVEKRIAGYLSLVDSAATLDEFDRLVLTYGADVCAIELAKNRAIASAVEQTRGDWVQMWLSGSSADDQLLITRAQQAGFDVDSSYVVTVFRATTLSGVVLPIEPLVTLVRDDLARRGINGAVGQHVDAIVILYPLDGSIPALIRTRALVEELRAQLAMRTPSGVVSAGISRPVISLSSLREAYRSARNALNISAELGHRESTTFYGDLKLFQLLLSIKEQNLTHLRQFYDESLRPLVDHDDRKQGDLIRTLNGFFEANGNLAKAAIDLDVHRNTLVYRLERITELTGLDLNDADNRLILHLALKIQRVLATMPDGT